MLSPAAAALLDYSNKRARERMDRLTRQPRQVVSPTTRDIPETRQETHVTRPAWGTLPVDRLCYEDAVVQANKPGRAGLLAYKKAWGVK